MTPKGTRGVGGQGVAVAAVVRGVAGVCDVAVRHAGDVAAPFDAADRLGDHGEALVDQLTKRGTQRRHTFGDGIHLGRAVRYLLGRHHMHRPIVSQIVVLTTVTTFDFDPNSGCSRPVAVFAPGWPPDGHRIETPRRGNPRTGIGRCTNDGNRRYS